MQGGLEMVKMGSRWTGFCGGFKMGVKLVRVQSGFIVYFEASFKEDSTWVSDIFKVSSKWIHCELKASSKVDSRRALDGFKVDIRRILKWNQGVFKMN